MIAAIAHRKSGRCLATLGLATLVLVVALGCAAPILR